MIKIIPNDYQQLRAIAKELELKETTKADIQQALKDRGWLSDLWDLVSDEAKRLYEVFKDWFRGGLWIHIYLDDEDRIRIRITDGPNGPAITAYDLSEKEAKKVLKELPKGNVQKLYAKGYIKKRTRVNHAIAKAKRLQS